MGIPVVEGYTQNSAASSSTINLTKPSGVAVGDLLVILVMNDTNTNTAQWDAVTYKPDADTWTFVNTAGNNSCDTHVGAFIRIADGTEGATINVAAQATKNYCGVYIRVSGIDTDDELDVTGADYMSSSNLSTAPVTGITTGQADTLAFFLAAYDGNNGGTLTVDSPWTIGDQDLESIVQTIWGTQGMASAAATGTADCNTTGASNGWSGFCFSINGAASGGPTIPVFYHHYNRNMK